MTPDVSRQRLQRVVATLLVAVLPWLVAPGHLQPDTKTDLVVSPARYLQRALWAWNDHTGIGELQNQAYGYLWPMGTLFLAGDAAGMPGWAVQRLWWTILLVLAFLGAERLARRVAGLPAIPALLTGAVFALSPRVLTVLAEISVEVWPYALAPWLVLAAHRMVGPGAKGADRRRGAVVTGLLAACLGGVNATVSLVALVPAAAWILLAPRRRGRWRALGWWSFAVALGSLWWLGPLLVLGEYSYPFLDHIEVAAMTTAVASVTNVLRGTEHWIAFILTGGDHPTWQSGWVLAQSVTAIIATTVLAGLGLAGILRRRGERETTDDERGSHLTRWALVLVLVGAVAMAAGRSGSGSGPLAGVVQEMLDGPLAPLRNVHKADLLVRLPVAIGVGLLAHWATRVERGAGALARQVVVVVSVLALIGALSPVWLGRVGDAWAPEGIPAVWTVAADEVDEAAAEDGGTTLVLPGARSADFTWGRVTDEPLRALAESPVLTRAAAPLGHPGATRVLDHLDELTATGRGQPHLADGLRRLGVSRVVVRGGLSPDLGAVDSRHVAATLEASPGLSRIWSQGEGQEEISLWRLDEPATPATVVPRDGVVPAAASPEGWFALVAAGMLDPDAVLRLTGSGEEAQVRTDTLRWQAVNSGRTPTTGASPTLPAQDARPGTVGTRDLAPGGTGPPVEETTRFHSGLSGLTTSSSAADPFARGWRGAGAGAAALVDGDSRTAWVSGDGRARQQVTLRLPTRSRPTSVLVHEAWGGDLGDLTSVSVGGSEGEKPQGSQTWRVPLDGSARQEVTIDLTTTTDADGNAPPVGVREVELEGVPELGTGLTLPAGEGPVLLTRDPRGGAVVSAGEDPADLVRRVGALPESRVRAAVRVRPDDAGQDLLAAPWSLQGSTPPAGAETSLDLEEWPVAAVDGDTSTRWTPAAGAAEPTLSLDLGEERRVETIRLSRSVGPVTVATDSRRYVLPAGTELTIPAQRTRQLTLTFARPPGRAVWSGPEVSLPGVEGPGGQVRLTCTGAGSVGRADGSIGLGLTAPLSQLVAGDTVTASSCGNLPAGEGTITAAGVPGLVPERVALVPTDWAAAEVAPRRPVSSREHAGQWTFDVGAGEESVLVLTQGANDGWRAVDESGRELSATTIDGWRQGFLLPEGDAGTVRVEFTPNDDHRWALTLGAGAVVLLALWLALELALRRRDPARGEAVVEAGGPAPPGQTGDAPFAVRSVLVGVLLAALVGLVVAGPMGLAAGALGGLVPVRHRPLAVAVVLSAAGIALSVLGVAERQSAGAWVSQGLGAFTLGVLAAALARAYAGGREPAPDAPADSTTGAPDPR
ncbi:alpha-(1-_3)-arabinofuranosyltransferase domain-containing protein [Janibacter sp. GS2]|uniref:alpha-(1->3)-arabinofuranosyltransferase domain-containing protein n=1 Tax=Janibacter sp. GS2 TaxID=3442646 RepID=UPI003EBF41AC